MSDATIRSSEISDIRTWMAHPVTKMVWERLLELKNEGDISCHAAIEMGEMQEASNWNAYMNAIMELLEVPEELIEEMK